MSFYRKYRFYTSIVLAATCCLGFAQAANTIQCCKQGSSGPNCTKVAVTVVGPSSLGEGGGNVTFNGPAAPTLCDNGTAAIGSASYNGPSCPTILFASGQPSGNGVCLVNIPGGQLVLWSSSKSGYTCTPGHDAVLAIPGFNADSTGYSDSLNMTCSSNVIRSLRGAMEMMRAM